MSEKSQVTGRSAVRVDENAQSEKPTVSERLRAETRARHEALHDVVDLGLLSGSIEAYTAGLRRYLLAVSTVEQLLTRALSVQEIPAVDGHSWQQRLVKTQWLENDLRFFGSADGGDRVAANLDRTRASSEANDVGSEAKHLSARFSAEPFGLPQFAGTSYVMEGMTLGGTYISKAVQAKLNLGDEGVEFFRGYGNNTKRNWLAMKQFLDSCDTQGEECVDQIVNSACETFDYFADVLSGRVAV